MAVQFSETRQNIHNSLDNFYHNIDRVLVGIENLSARKDVFMQDMQDAINTIRKRLQTVIAGIKNAFNSMIDSVAQFMNNVKTFVKELPQNIQEAVRAIPGKLQEGLQTVQRKFKEIGEAIKTTMQSAAQTIGELPEKTKAAVQAIPGKLQAAGESLKEAVQTTAIKAKEGLGNAVVVVGEKLEEAKIAIAESLESKSSKKLSELTAQVENLTNILLTMQLQQTQDINKAPEPPANEPSTPQSIYDINKAPEPPTSDPSTPELSRKKTLHKTSERMLANDGQEESLLTALADKGLTTGTKKPGDLTSNAPNKNGVKKGPAAGVAS